MSDSKFYIIKEDALPTVFQKVVKAKEMLETGKASSTSEAAAAAGISRSAFYKYRDMVFKYSGNTSDEIVTIQVTLLDKPGALSALLSELHLVGANILTVNQNIPSSEIALVTVSFKSDTLTIDVRTLLERICENKFMIKAKQIISR